MQCWARKRAGKSVAHVDKWRENEAADEITNDYAGGRAVLDE